MSVADVALSPIRKESMHSAGHCGNQLGRSASDSILIYLNLGSSVMPMCVSESDSIASVKLRIQTSKGFVAKKQKLVFEGRELARSDTPIKDYGVTGGDFLHLVLRLSDLLHITVRTICGKEFDFHVDRYQNVGYLKQRILRKGEVVVAPKGQELFCNGEKLDDQRVINDICNKDDAEILWVAQKSAEFSAEHIEDGVDITVVAEVSKERKDENVDEWENQPEEHVVENGRESPIRFQDILLDPIIVNPKAELPHFIWDMVNSTFEGLEKGCEPIRSSEGTGGTYLLRDCLGEKFVSVFKPMDEEPSAVNNPCGLPVSSDGEGLKKGTRVGEGAVKEVAAYILDHPRSGPRMLTGEAMGFAGVPPTLMVKCLHKGFNHSKGYQGEPRNVKIGSLQMFMKNDGSCEDMGPRSFPIDEVHKISVFDIRMANADRHSGNILIGKGKEGQTLLIPIDHGYCLPESVSFDTILMLCNLS